MISTLITKLRTVLYATTTFPPLSLIDIFLTYSVCNSALNFETPEQ